MLKIHYLFFVIAYICLLLFVAECLIYYLVMIQCDWPKLVPHSTHEKYGQISESEWSFHQRDADKLLPRSSGQGRRAEAGDGRSSAEVLELDAVSRNLDTDMKDSLRAFFIADTHLLGSRLGHWFDKLRREWQMERGFQAALRLLSPEVVFVLGDLTDEGKWASDKEFEATADRFWKMFRHPPGVHFKVVVGNHDVGFHDLMNKHKVNRFMDAFSSTGVEVFTLKNISFILLNSMAFHGDGCNICSLAEKELRRVSVRFNCSRFGTPDGIRDEVRESWPNRTKSRCEKYKGLPSSPPILLQHFPLYRPSDEMCDGIDGTPLDEKYIPHGERREVISRGATDKLLSWLQPRLVLSAHTHHGCYIVHQNSTPEISVPSFSWRNRNNPSIVLATISPSRIAINKCFLPEESLVIRIYVVSGFVLVTCLLWSLLVFILKQVRGKHVKES